MRKIEDSEVRKIFKHGDSRAITLPIELLRELGWRDNQKLVAKKYGKGILISDWEN
jgi:antitoxin component of MazEF toxin-antitoxin module